jgi:4-hydroxy-4-methyl-2-oxoglutarate aldolase
VNPGDVVVGDADGVVVVPQASAEALLARLDARVASMAEYQRSVARGDFSNAWVDKNLSENGLDPEPTLE